MPIFTNFMAKALQGRPATPFNVPAGMNTAWIDPNTGAQAYEGQQGIREAFKPGTGPNAPTSVIGIGVAEYDAIQRQQMMQQQYGTGFSGAPVGNGTFLDPSFNRR